MDFIIVTDMAKQVEGLSKFDFFGGNQSETYSVSKNKKTLIYKKRYIKSCVREMKI